MELSHKEKARAEKTVEQLRKMHEHGYKTKEITIGSSFANFMGFVWGVLLSAPVIFVYWKKIGHIVELESSNGYWWEVLVWFAVVFVLLIVHECIHGFCMYLFNGHRKDMIDYGINSVIPYCTSLAPIKKWQYIIILLMPTVIIGVATSIFALYIGRFWWLLLAIDMFVGGGGDLTIASKLILQKDTDNVIIAHPYKCGFFSLSNDYENDEYERIWNEFEDLHVKDKKHNVNN